MSIARSLRRAAERKANKQARKAAQQAGHSLSAAQDAPEFAERGPEFADQPIEPVQDNFGLRAPLAYAEDDFAPAPPKPAISQARLTANRANSQLSTGPKTQEGKRTSSKNAVTTALTGRTVLLSTDDADQYAGRLAEYEKLYQPSGVREIEIVQALCDAWWRLDRIPGLIEALYVKGAAELADTVSNYPAESRAAMLRAETYVAFERHFRNLQIQEQRLHRQSHKLQEELKQLQKERWERDAANLAQAGMFYLAAKKERKRFDPAELGFEFSVREIEDYLHGKQAAQAAADHFAGPGKHSPASSKHAA